MSTLQALVDEFDKLRLENPYDSGVYDKVLGALAAFPEENAHAVDKVYHSKIKQFRLTQSELNHWLSTIRSIGDIEERYSLEYEFYNSVIDDYTVVPILQSFLALARHLLNSEEILENDYRAALSKALSVCSYDFEKGNNVWRIVLDHFEQVFVLSRKDGDLQILIKLHHKRLSYPHAEIEKSFQELSNLISNYAREQYEEQMSLANEIYKNSLARMKYYEEYERQIQNNPGESSVWINYMEGVYKHQKENLNAVLAIFERSIQSDVAYLSKWQEVWLSFIDILYTANDSKLLNTILSKFVRSFPNSCHTYCESIRNCDLSTKDGQKKLEVLSQRISAIDLKNNSAYKEWKLVAEATLHTKFQALLQSTALIELHDFMNEVSSSFDFALNSNDHGHHGVEKLAISICIKLGKDIKAIEFLEKLYKKFASEASVWLYAVKVSTDVGREHEYVRQLFKTALQTDSLDDLQRVIDEWLLFEELNGDMASYNEALVTCRKSCRRKVKKTASLLTSPMLRKRSHDISAEFTRSREEYTVEVRNLPLNATEDDVKSLFHDCGEIKELTIVDAQGDRHALVEFTNELQVFLALTRGHKRLGNNDLIIAQAQKSLVFVNNYPSTFSQSEVRKMFELVGPLVSCRFPSQIKNKIRRFCYIQFLNANDALRCVAIYNGQKYWDENLKRELAWEVKFSRPQERKTRSVPISERKIRITNIAFSITEDELKNEFSSCGEVELVVLPRAVFDTKNKRMKQNGGIAIIAFRDARSVETALEKDGMELKGRPLNVAKQQINLTPADFNPLRSIGLVGVSSTLNNFQIKNVLEQAAGAVSKVLLLPEHEAALVEFSSVNDSGKVALSGTPLIIEGNEITVGTKEDILSLIGNTKTTNQLVESDQRPLMPTSIKRRRV